MLEIAIQGLEKSYNVTKVLDEVTFDVQRGERIGIIGRNGTGKTTLFKILMGKEPYNGGTITFRKNMKLGYLDQLPDYGGSLKVRDVIRMALKEVEKRQDQMRDLEGKMGLLKDADLEKAMTRYAKVSAEFEAIGGYERFVDEQKLIEGFGFDDAFLNRPFALLSGGEKTKVMLGQLILSQPDVLLLDEPSNHLDTQALEWLETYLLKFPGAVVAISHDRFFLDHVVKKIIEIEDRVAQVYHGNYAYYKIEKEVRMTLMLKAFGNQQKQLRAMEEAVERFRAWSCGGHNIPMVKKMKNMQKRIERIEKLDKPITHRKQMKVSFSSNERSGNEVLRVQGLSHGFNNEILFENITFLLGYKEAFALLGPNGCGKSTLLKIITGDLLPLEGTFKIGSRVKMAYLDQNVVLGDEEMTVLELYRSHYPCKEGIARSVLARSLFMGEDIFKKVEMLSGGEKMRLKLCILMQQEVTLLVLDEPTNHLDIESREMLEATLASFEGTIIFVSHDRYFVKKLATRIGEIKGGKMRLYEGDYDYYKEKRVSNPSTIKSKSTPSMVKVDKIAPEIRYAAIEKQMEGIEQEMRKKMYDYKALEDLTREKEVLENEMLSLLEAVF